MRPQLPPYRSESALDRLRERARDTYLIERVFGSLAPPQPNIGQIHVRVEESIKSLAAGLRLGSDSF